MKQAMSLKQFEALVAAYGATPDNWPDNERTPMLSVLDSEPNAAGIMARAERLDGVLDHYLPPASADLQSRILSDMEAMLGNETDTDIIAFPQNPPRRARNAWAIVTGLAACFVGASFFASSSRKRALKVAAVFFCFGGTVSCVNDTTRNMG